MSVLTAPSTTPRSASPEARGAAVVAALALVASLLVAPPWRTSVLPRGQVAEFVAGALEVDRAGRWQAVAPGDFLAIGSRVRTPDEQATLAVQGGTLQLARGSEAVLRVDDVTLTGGRLLVDVDRVVGASLRTVEVEGRGTWRLDGGVAPRVGVYEGGAGVRLTGTDREVVVAGLQQVAIVDDAPDAAAGPLRYVATDPWDARLMVEAIAIDRQAAQLRQGLQAQYGSDPRPVEFYDDFAAVDEATVAALPRASDADAGIGPPADVLLAIVVIDLVARGAALPREAAVEEVLQPRSEGATYGIVLRTHGLTAQQLVDAFAVALARRAEIVSAQPSPEPTAGPGPDPTPGPSPGPSPTPSPSPSPTPTDEPSPEPSPSESDALDEIIDELPDPVQSPVEDLTDLIRDAVGDPPLPGLP